MGKQTIKQVVVTLVSDDSEDYPEVQVSYNGKATKCFRLSPYGLISNPVNGSLGIAYSSQGQEAVKYVIPVSTINRMKGLKEGECGLYNESNGDFVILTNDKGVEIFSSVGLVANINGDAEITADNVIVTAALTTINGNVIVNGLVTCTGLQVNGASNSTGNFTTTGDVTAGELKVPGSPDYTVHVHNDPQGGQVGTPV